MRVYLLFHKILTTKVYCLFYNYIVSINWPFILISEHIEHYIFGTTFRAAVYIPLPPPPLYLSVGLIGKCVKTFL